jgi:hypothetical protein
MMYNPYVLLNRPILGALLKQPMYFVRQHYPRGLSPEGENSIPFLLTHYAHHETDKERAERHMRLLTRDRYRFLYDSTSPDHAEKLMVAAGQPGGYRIYINLLPKKWKADASMKLMIGSYVRDKLPWWNYSPADKLQVTLKERYGELFIALLWKGRQTEVLLEEIENFQPCVMT